MEKFDRYIGQVIDNELGLRCATFGYQYSEIARSLMSVYFCGGDCVEDVTSHLMPHLSLHPTLRTCSSDTILRGISELSTANTTYVSETGRSYDFNTATKLNGLLVKILVSTGQLVAGNSYDLDFDHQFIETEKYDAKMTYKKFTGYSPGVLQRMKILQGRLLRLERESDLPQLYRLAFSAFFRALDALPCSTIHPKEQMRVSTSYTLLEGFVVEGETTLYHQTESVERVEWRIAPCSDGLELTACYSGLLEYRLAVEAALAGLWC